MVPLENLRVAVALGRYLDPAFLDQQLFDELRAVPGEITLEANKRSGRRVPLHLQDAAFKSTASRPTIYRKRLGMANSASPTSARPGRQGLTRADEMKSSPLPKSTSLKMPAWYIEFSPAKSLRDRPIERLPLPGATDRALQAHPRRQETYCTDSPRWVTQLVHRNLHHSPSSPPATLTCGFNDEIHAWLATFQTPDEHDKHGEQAQPGHPRKRRRIPPDSESRVSLSPASSHSPCSAYCLVESTPLTGLKQKHDGSQQHNDGDEEQSASPSQYPRHPFHAASVTAQRPMNRTHIHA
ncbi:hypothetical protein CORC01_10771 [Colletotrichum orchidophilum]|uniref:Uncharacterized protein n=1 Tax=Colletotrichum orchidophilum TaxID=1209926 RepID=A0A1G4AXV4_9PEZI|nr:uncharacterized protein CORC01_10771 [Colletotrichum orchidophilum]OHE93872.1 hypothetical protein CORC01_10771 [Colletotrichum orchidophilum]